MSKFIFQVSKFNATKNRLFLKQRYNRAKDAVTAMATLYMDAHYYVSGMHYAYQDNEGDVVYSFDKNEAAKDVKVDVTVNFRPEQLIQLQQQISDAGLALTKPPVDENGVSELMGWQLHVVISDDDITYVQENDEKWGKKLIYKVQPQQVKRVFLVTAGDEAYIEAPNSSKIDLNLAMKALYTTREVEVKQKPTTVEEAQTSLLDFSQAKSRGQRRKEKKEQKQQETTQVEKASQAVIEAVNTSTQIVLVDDEDKPE